MLFAKSSPPISYSEDARFNRAIQSLAVDQQAHIIASINKHLASPHIGSLQRRGRFLYVTVAEEKGDLLSIYDFGDPTIAQNCLVALTDCLRSRRSAVPVLMPAAPPAA